MKKSEKIQIQEQEPKPIGFYSVCFYSIKGLSYPEENHAFDLKAKTYRGIINKIRSVYENEYLKDDQPYRIYNPMESCDIWENEPKHFTFSAAYTLGPKVTYHIYIKEIYSESLYD